MRLLINKDIEIVSHNTNEHQADLLEYVLAGFADVMKKYSFWFECKIQPDCVRVVITTQKITLESEDINWFICAVDELNFVMQASDQFAIKLRYIPSGYGCNLNLEMSIEGTNQNV